MIVPITETPCEVELNIGFPQITGVAAVFSAGGHFPKEIVRHVFDGVQTVAVWFVLVGEPAEGTDQHGADILGNRIAHVVLAVSEPPGRGVTAGRQRIHAGVGEGFRDFPGVVLAVPVRIGPIEPAVSVGIHKGFLVGKRVGGEVAAGTGDRDRQIRVRVVFGIVGLADADVLGEIVVFVKAKTCVRTFVGDVLTERIAI